MKETKVYVDELPKSCGCCEFYSQDKYCAYCLMLNEKLRYIDKDKDCPLKSLHEYKKELVAKVLGMVRENLKEELLLTKNENQEEAKLKLVKTYSIDLDVLNKIEKEILNGYTKI